MRGWLLKTGWKTWRGGALSAPGSQGVNLKLPGRVPKQIRLRPAPPGQGLKNDEPQLPGLDAGRSGHTPFLGPRWLQHGRGPRGRRLVRGAAAADDVATQAGDGLGVIEAAFEEALFDGRDRGSVDAAADGSGGDMECQHGFAGGGTENEWVSRGEVQGLHETAAQLASGPGGDPLAFSIPFCMGLGKRNGIGELGQLRA